MDKIQQIPLEHLCPSEGNRRVGGFDKAKLEQLAESIKAVGVQQPAVVRPIVDDGTDSSSERQEAYEIVAGERRWRAAKLAGLTALPCVVRELDDVTVLKIQTIENLQREDIHPLDEADGYSRLLDKAGYDVEHLAAEVGKSTSYVYQRLKLLDLVPKAREQLIAGKITAGHARLIARLQPLDQNEALKYLAERERFNDGEVTVGELEDWIHEEVLLDLSGAAFQRTDATLVPAAGACTTCPKRTGFQPALFEEIDSKKHDYCLDHACFKAKQDALLERNRAALNGQEHLEVVGRNSFDWRTDEKLIKAGAKREHEWEEAKKNAEGAVPVLVVSGPNRGKLTYGVERKQAKYSYHQTPAEKAAAERRAREQKLAAATRRRLWDAVMTVATEELAEEIPEKVLRMIARAFYGRIWDDARKALIAAESWEAPPKKEGQYGSQRAELGEQRIKKMTAAELRLFLVKCALAPSLMSSAAWVIDQKRALPDAATLFGLDVGTIEAAVKAEAAEKDAAKKARESKKTKASKRVKKPPRGETKKAPRETARKEKARA